MEAHVKRKCWAWLAKASVGKEGKIQLSPAAALRARCPAARRVTIPNADGKRDDNPNGVPRMACNSGSGKHTPWSQPPHCRVPCLSPDTNIFSLFSYEFPYVWLLIQRARGRTTQQPELALVSSPLLPALGLLLLLTQNNSIGLLRRLPNNPYGRQPHLGEHQPHGRPGGWKENQRSC